MKRALLAVVLLAVALSATGCDTPKAGEIGVVRNGGPWDNHNIRGVQENGTGASWNGWGSEVHWYPIDTQQRYLKFETCYGDHDSPVACKGADFPGIEVPTSDGVEVRIDGTVYLTTSFNNTGAGKNAVKLFDQQYATRTFEGEKHVYDGTSGWIAFLKAVPEPIVANNLRETIAGVTCADLLSSCALVQNQGNTASVKVKANAGNQSNIQRIQEKVETNLATDLLTVSGTDPKTHQRVAYFKGIQFKIRQVVPPPKVKDAIETAQAAFAQVSQAQAKKQSATLEAQANERRQSGYNKCRICGDIDKLRSLPRGLQALGGGVTVGLK